MVIDRYTIRFILVNLAFFGALVVLAIYLSNRYDEYARRCKDVGGVVLRSGDGFVCVKTEILHP